MPKKILLVGWLLLLAMEIFFLLYAVHYFHWSGPVQDFWGSVSFIEKTLSSGNWFGADLWVAQNNHRLVLPRLAFLVDYYFFHGNNYFLAGFSLLLLAAEALILYFLFAGKKQGEQRWLACFPALVILLLPAMSYNLLNTFNIQWIQCAFLALSACGVYSYGLYSGRNTWVSIGILLAILCCFTTFSLTAIWPALFLLLWLHSAHKKQWLALGFLFFLFSIVFIFALPLDKNLGTGSQYTLPPLLDIIEIVFVMTVGLLSYLVEYLASPLGEKLELITHLATIFSLLWLVFSLFRHQRSSTGWQTRALLAVMFFVVCLAITTGLGRAFIGELAQGIRFYPMALLYWAACLLHVMTCLLSMDNKKSFLVANIFCLGTLSGLAVLDAKKTSERLAEEHNRYARMQMAYITDNLHPNALYENLVPEWRATSYPGILAAIPFLKSHQWGVFHQDIGKFILEHPVLAKENLAVCMNVAFQEKPRNNDKGIRNMTFRHPDAEMNIMYPYLLIYFHENIVAAAFRQRYSLFETKNKSVWIGMSSLPRQESEDYVITALNNNNELCRVKSFSPDYSPTPERQPGSHD